MTKEIKFKRRYVLGEGYPEFVLYQEAVRLKKTITRGDCYTLKKLNEFPLLRLTTPKYRLVLEKVRP